MPTLPIFLVSFLLHAFVGWSVVPDLAETDPALGVATSGVLTLSALLMPMGLIAKKLVKAPLAEVLTWLGLLSMGLGSTLFVLTVLREAALLLVKLIDSIWPFALSVVDVRADTAMLLPAVGLLVTFLGFWNARRTATVVRVDVPIANLPEVLHGFNVAQISDIHMGPTIRRSYLTRIVERVNSLDADMVAITGDLVDGSVRELRDDVAPLKKLTSTHGTFFVTGNHEYYSGAPGWIDALRALGVKVLLNEHVVLHHNADEQDPETSHDGRGRSSRFQRTPFRRSASKQSGTGDVRCAGSSRVQVVAGSPAPQRSRGTASRL